MLRMVVAVQNNAVAMLVPAMVVIMLAAMLVAT